MLKETIALVDNHIFGLVTLMIGTNKFGGLMGKRLLNLLTVRRCLLEAQAPVEPYTVEDIPADPFDALIHADVYDNQAYAKQAMELYDQIQMPPEELKKAISENVPGFLAGIVGKDLVVEGDTPEEVIENLGKAFRQAEAEENGQSNGFAG